MLWLGGEAGIASGKLGAASEYPHGSRSQCTLLNVDSCILNYRIVSHFSVHLIMRRSLPFGKPGLSILIAVTLFALPKGGNSAPGVILSPQSAHLAGVQEGELLLGELNCVSCHAAEGRVVNHLVPRVAPSLENVGSRVTPQYLRAYLTDPQQEKPGAIMPDLLHGLSSPAKAETVENLVQYLASLKSDSKEEAFSGANPYKMQEGRLLFHQVGCVACHAPDEPASNFQPALAGENATPTARRASVESSLPLGNLARKYTVPALTQFLIDPLKARPAGRMPSSNLTRGEASSIAMYLLRGQTNSPAGRATAKVKGLGYDYFEANLDRIEQMETLQPVSSGIVDGFSLAPQRRNNNIGFRFTGFVRIPTDGEYTFYTASDDGSRLYIGGRQVVDNNGVHATTERKGSIRLTAGDQPILVLWFNAGGPAELKVSYQGPGVSKQPIPPSSLSFQGIPMRPLDEANFVADARKAAQGKQLFARLGCAHCHSRLQSKNGATPAPPAKPWAALSPLAADGCLGSKVGPGRPRYAFSDQQRELLRATLSASASWTKPPAPREQVQQRMAALNCYACHSRNGVGGPAADRSGYFMTLGPEDLGDEGRIPPHLTAVGNKLRPEWLREVLWKHGAVRPYLATRMPQFGEANVKDLAAAFLEADAARPVYPDVVAHPADAKYGRVLVGSGGLSCISCHNFGSYKSLGINVMDLTQMTKRLRHDWFHRYLLDPPSLRPGTRMPLFWPEGKSLRQDIFQGDTHRQVDAIWVYLSKGSEAGVPPGMIQGKMELVADKHALIYRAFISESGTRGIGVAFPEKANLTFDANEMRPALIWQGPFIDAAKHRVGRGEGFEGPLGYNVVKMPAGPPLAVLSSPSDAWPAVTGRTAGYRMRGYQLDAKRRPTFKFSFDSIQIEDKPVALPGELEAFFRRTLTLQAESPKDNLWFRAWVGDQIESRPNGTYLADGKIELKLSSENGTRPVVRRSGGKTELLLPVSFQGSRAKIIEEIIW
jgi:cytochrome c2